MDGFLDLQVNHALDSAFAGQVASSRIREKTDDVDIVGKQFEAMFMTQMIEQMFANLQTGGMFGGGHSEKIYRSMMAREYANEIAERGGLGIADMVSREIISLQEEAKK